jgi:hypothetical protein
MKVRKKPVIVEAWKVSDLLKRWAAHGLSGLPLPIADAYEEGRIDFPSPKIGSTKPERLDVITLEGIMTANPGWWIILGVTGELYPCKGDIFWETYEEVDHEPRLVT